MPLIVDVDALKNLMYQHGLNSGRELADHVNNYIENRNIPLPYDRGRISARTIERALQGHASGTTIQLLASSFGVGPDQLTKFDLGEVLAKAAQDIIKALTAKSAFDINGTLLAASALCAHFACGVAINLKGDKEGKSDLCYAQDFVDMVQVVAKGMCEDVLSEE